MFWQTDILGHIRCASCRILRSLHRIFIWIICQKRKKNEQKYQKKELQNFYFERNNKNQGFLLIF